MRGIFSHSHRNDVFHSGTHAGQPASSVRSDDPQPAEATTLFSQQGGHPTGSQDPWARYQGSSATAAPAQTTALVGSSGQAAESEFGFGIDADTSSDEGNGNLDCSDTPVYLTEEQQLKWLLLIYQKHNRRWRRCMKKPVQRVRRAVRRA
eukprot:5533774-Pyramimonas_sp.AAC.1